MHIFARMKLASLKKTLKKQYELRDAGNAGKLDELLKAYLALAAFFEKHSHDAQLPFADLLALENYRAAGKLGSTAAQFRLAELLLERAKFYASCEGTPWNDPGQLVYARAHFDEVYTLLTAAAQAGHALAMRLHGMIHVNGWGMPVNTDQGFKMVIESINMENAWDRATKIFESLGLNSPEFFATLRAQQK